MTQVAQQVHEPLPSFGCTFPPQPDRPPLRSPRPRRSIRPWARAGSRPSTSSSTSYTAEMPSPDCSAPPALPLAVISSSPSHAGPSPPPCPPPPPGALSSSRPRLASPRAKNSACAAQKRAEAPSPSPRCPAFISPFPWSPVTFSLSPMSLGPAARTPVRRAAP
ncbi:hypothetical protein B0H15DRAFT_949347 [Mycena belliarum]|uniref:Uncharacterized protein n=1 Tax=Mycena belliarum TaxID=1033014 RepID=A0AAD6U2Y7_9AGAR|nr:hypothetical protein B0H15DRAFT_949347 [Mycena belliae]